MEHRMSFPSDYEDYQDMHTEDAFMATMNQSGSTVPITSTVNPHHDPIALYSPGPGLLSLPQLPEAPCSVNVYFDAHGMKGQATGRGRTPQEAAHNLRDTISATREALAPTPVVPQTLAQRLSHYAACAMEKAIEEGDHVKLAQIGEAVALVTRGSVYHVPIQEGHPAENILKLRGEYAVWDHQSIEQRYINDGGYCDCTDGKWACTHAMAVWFAIKCEALGDAETYKEMDKINLGNEECTAILLGISA